MGYAGFDLSGKVAMITGAGRGLGKAIALGFAEAGADLFLCARTLPELEAVAADVRGRGRKAEVARLEVRDGQAVETVVAAGLAAFGRIDVLVNNAGINIPEPALDVTEEHWDTILDINLKGAFFCTQAVGRSMVARRSGKIINMASQMGLVGGARRAAYCASKGGLILLTKSLAVEWAPFGVTVNAIAPTFIETPLTRPFFTDQAFLEDVLRRIPMGRVGQPEDVVGAAVYLASPAADLVTGTTISVDGGWVAW